METSTFDLVHATLCGDKRGHDYHADCPFCGKPAVRGQTHFSYSYFGYKCFVCGERGGLIPLAKHLQCSLTQLIARTPPPPKPPKPPARWLDNAAGLVAKYTAHPERVILWQDYKPVSEDTILRYNLGIGVLPASQCQHRRLILPIYDEAGRVVCLRGRAFECDCGKWLAAGGWTLDMLPLYNLNALPDGGVLWIVENPVDALLISPYTGAATLSVSYWRDEWTAAMAEKRPSLVVVAYDNDLPGNGGAWRRDEMIAEWAKRQIEAGKRPLIPEARGVWLVNRLLANSINAVLYDWKDAPHKADIGSLLTQSTTF